MPNIPSNYTFEEVLHFYSRELSEDILSRAWKEVEEKKAIEQELERLRKHVERLEEQVYFRDEWIREVLKEADSATKVKGLKTFITVSLENSYIEL